MGGDPYSRSGIFHGEMAVRVVSRCCRPNGFVAPEKERMLGLLRMGENFLPDDARIGGRRGRMVWRVLDRQGREIGMGSPHELADFTAGEFWGMHEWGTGENGTLPCVELHPPGCSHDGPWNR